MLSYPLSNSNFVHQTNCIVVVSHRQRIGCQPEKLLRTVDNPARGLLYREKIKNKKVWQHPLPLSGCFSADNEIKPRGAATCLVATQVSVCRVSVQGFLRLVDYANGCRFAKFYASVCDDNFLSLVTILFSWRCLPASISSFLYTTMNLRPPSVTISNHTSDFNAVAFQSPAMPNAGCRSVRNRSTFSSFQPVLSALHPQSSRTRFASAATHRSFG